MAIYVSKKTCAHTYTLYAMDPSSSGRGSQRTPSLFTPKPSLEALKKPKAFVTIILCVACIVSKFLHNFRQYRIHL